MSVENILFLFLAVILIFFGHLLRALRWRTLLTNNKAIGVRFYFAALAFGYLFNTLLPLRVGELLRAIFFSQRTTTKLTHSIASIIVERAYDLLAMIVLIPLLLSFSPPATLTWLGINGILAAIVFGGMFSLFKWAGARRIFSFFANIFNDKIRFIVLDTAVNVMETQRNIRFIWKSFLLQSCLMWAFYIASYTMISKASNMGLNTTIDFFFGRLFQSSILAMPHQNKPAALLLFIYAFVPCLLIIIYAKMRHLVSFRLWHSTGWLTDPLLYLEKRTEDRFRESAQYEEFLCRYFCGDESVVYDFESYAIQDATVIRRLGGGSDAVTAVVQVGTELRYRKYAVSGAAQKLCEQYDWLSRYKDDLPLVPVLEGRKDQERFWYDMPYSITSRDFYDFIHMSSPDKSWDILKNVLKTIRDFHQTTEVSSADDPIVRTYIQRKVQENFSIIQKSFSQIFEQDTIEVNGRIISLALIQKFSQENYILQRLKLRQQCIIHGDLTIENIIFDSVLPKKWFLIDPNSVNIFNTPLLDYAKLFQSLHLGYESLGRNNPCSYTDGHIQFFMPRTLFYEDLFKRLCFYIKETFDHETYREIRLHEIIHYLRLIPYKIRKSPHTGFLFFGCLCLLIERYHQEFDAC